MIRADGKEVCAGGRAKPPHAVLLFDANCILILRGGGQRDGEAEKLDEGCFHHVSDSEDATIVRLIA